MYLSIHQFTICSMFIHLKPYIKRRKLLKCNGCDTGTPHLVGHELRLTFLWIFEE
jgi:hypothetical protein